jgi:hypothetical protein
MREGTENREIIADTSDALIESNTSSDTADTAGVEGGERQTPATPQPPTARNMRQKVARVTPWAMAMLALILVGMLSWLLSDTHPTDAASRPTPTATPLPTMTATTTPTPTPIDGFQFYHDPTNHYIIQYPLGWVISTDNSSQGIEFCDDCQNPGYIVQVNTPNNLGDVGPPANQNTADGWVTYALNGLASRLQSGTLTPLGPQQAIVIGGVVWQSGGALVTDSSGGARFRLQVYATVYENKPYILVLSTTDDRFTAGTIQFFGPMLQSFEFVKPTP